jgi:hypothetical protein
MLKGTFDLHTSPDSTTNRNVHPNECMPSSSQDRSPNLEVISEHQQRFGRHPTDVDLDQLKMVSGKRLPYEMRLLADVQNRQNAQTINALPNV